MKKSLFFLFLLIPSGVQSQITSENGNLMGEFISYEENLMPNEDSEAFVVPDSISLKRWKRMMDLFVAGSYSSAEDSLSTHFSSYEMVLLTDTSFANAQYYLIREPNPVTRGWGLYVSNPSYQRDLIVAVPHPLHDSFTPQQGVNMFRYLGGRVLAMAGTHRCANDEASFSDGTTKVCSDTDTSEKYKVSDMAHYDSTAFQIAHESIKELSTNVYAINLHGHANSSCEDVFLSSGRSDDPQTSLQSVRDSLIALNVDAAMTGDGSSCTLAGTTNVQGRFINGSTNPADDQPESNTGFFFHVEQSQLIRRQMAQYKFVIEAFSKVIPRSFTTVSLPEFPSLVFNEIHYDPDPINGDANNNGSVGSVSDEFIEIVNASDTAISLDKWIFSDSGNDRHIFENGTNLLPNQAVVVFGGTPTGDYGGANVQTSSTGSVSLSNSGEKIYLRTPARDIVTFVDFPGDESGESLTLNPDVTGDSLYAHTTADTDDNSIFSPGTKINGDPFLPFIEISGDAGWRMLASPTNNMPIQDLVTFTPIQGFSDGHSKNFYTNWNGTEWTFPSSLSDSLENGKGFIIYFFDNSNAESSTLPLKLRATGTVPSSDVTIDLHTSGDKFNFIGNPFDSAIDFTSISVNGGSLASSIGQVYNPATQSYQTTTSLGDSVSSWQGIMIENSTASSITVPTSAIIESGNFLKERSSEASYVVLSLKDTNSGIEDELVVLFSEKASLNWDTMDAMKLAPLSSTYVSLSGIDSREDLEINQTQISLPNDLKEPISIPLEISTSLTVDRLSIRIKKQVNIPEELSFSLVNNSSGTALSLDNSSIHQVGITNGKATSMSLSLEFDEGEEVDDRPDTFELYQNYPNPFNPNTLISYSLPATSNVRFEVFSITGALVKTESFEGVPTGNHSFSFNAGSLSSGVYIYRISTSFGSSTGKMTLIK
ncbi:MAG: lamin tail domain-containing protein [Balneolaceae bacterium]